MSRPSAEPLEPARRADAFGDAVRAVAFHSETRWSWLGRLSPRFPPEIREMLGPRAVRAHVLLGLQLRLYDSFYTHGRPVPATVELDGPAPFPFTPFAARLARANAGRGYREGGWRVLSLEPDGWLAVRDGVRIRIVLADLAGPDGDRVRAGSELVVRRSKELPCASPGFYLSVGDAGPPRALAVGQGGAPTGVAVEDAGTPPSTVSGPGPVVRLYWNLAPEGAHRLVRHVTVLLNRARLPFVLKTLDEARAYERSDAAVLYLERPGFLAAAADLRRLHGRLRRHLADPPPAFTKRLAEGLGLAEDPGTTDSFGLERCRIFADGLIRAHERGARGVRRRLAVVAERFEEEGLSLARPHLNPGSEDGYDVFHEADGRDTPETSPGGGHVRRARQAGSATPLVIAHSLGLRLAREAVWAGEACGWIGPRPAAAGDGPAWAALGPDLYEGTAGLGLFLAEVHDTTGEPELARCASGSLRGSLRTAETGETALPAGFYDGWPGIAFAAARAGRLLGDDEFLDRARGLALRSGLVAWTAASSASRAEAEPDLLTGSAGAVLGLAILAELLSEPELLDVAERGADDLLGRATPRGEGLSWRSREVRAWRDLTGLAHGAAGIALALLEVHLATGREDLRLAVRRAFVYERTTFDPRRLDWPDFRRERGRLRRPQSFGAGWCHGAPGIALSRLRGYEILHDEILAEEARTALATTRSRIEAALARGGESGVDGFSLCHGLAGNAEILLEGARAPGGETSDPSGLIARVAERGIERFAPTGARRRRARVPGPEAPGLMLGLAGIGRFYLRLHDPRLPSVLLPRREDYGAAGGAPAPPATAAPSGRFDAALGRGHALDPSRPASEVPC